MWNTFGCDGTPIAATVRPPRKGPMWRQRSPSYTAGLTCAPSAPATSSSAGARRCNFIAADYVIRANFAEEFRPRLLYSSSGPPPHRTDNTRGARPEMNVRRFFALLALCFAFVTPAAFALSPNIVISQVYGGGGNAGATLKNDFIELYNRGNTTVNVTGWSVQYASSGGTTWTNSTTLSGSIA